MILSYVHNNNLQPKPLFRWAGGKSWLIKYLSQLLPEHFNNYHEPFLGGGSVFFHLKPLGKSYLSDINSDLIESYLQIRDNLDDVVTVLSEFYNTKEEYYRIRNTVFQTKIGRAARFLYLNRTCFNGLYRVNRQGKFNVPFGYRTLTRLFEVETLRNSVLQLKSAIIWQADFEDSLLNIKKSDLVYIDPPYTVSHVENGFIQYNEKLFSMDDQNRLAVYIKEIHRRKAFFILSSAKHHLTNELFGDFFSPTQVLRASTIGGKGSKRGIIEESIFTNIRPKQGGHYG